MLQPKTEQILQKLKMQILFNREAAAFYVPYCYLPVNGTEDPNIKRMATDGQQILVNEEFFQELDSEKAMGIFFHEITHNVLGHTAVDFPKVTDEEVLKTAKEIAVNNIVLDCGLNVIDEATINRDYSGWSTIQIYHDLYQQKQNDPNSQPPPGCGCVQAPDPSNGNDPSLQNQQTQAGAAQKLTEAQQSLKAQGSEELAEKIGKLIRDLVTPQIDWAEELTDAIEKGFDGSHIDLSNPIRQYLAQGIYIPKYKDDTIENLYIALDLSCSLTNEELAKAQRVIDEIRQVHDIESTSIITYNTRITDHQLYDQYDTISIEDMVGRGGTRGDCVFEYIEQHDEQPFTLLMITDTEDCIETPEEKVPYPVIWLNTSKEEPFRGYPKPAFGKIITLTNET